MKLHVYREYTKPNIIYLGIKIVQDTNSLTSKRYRLEKTASLGLASSELLARSKSPHVQEIKRFRGLNDNEYKVGTKKPTNSNC